MNETSQQPGALSLRGLRKEYPGGAVAVEGLDLDIQAGEFVTLLGPSGCGKTTTLRMIAGFETPTRGQVLLDGKDIVPVAPHRRPMAMVFQSYALFPHMSVRDNVAFGLRIQKVPRAVADQRVTEALSTMGLASLGGRFPNQLSGGQQQRVALARAIVTQPKVLLFDEPLSNLDAKLRDQMRLEIRRLQREAGITSVFVTHDQDEAMTMSDKIVVMSQGRIEQVGTPSAIYRHPASHFVADFIGQANFLEVLVLRVESDTAEIRCMGRQLRVPAAPHASVSAGGSAEMLIRPESIHVEAEGARSGGIRGCLKEVTYFGDRVEYLVGYEGGTLRAAQENPRELLDPGSSVTLTFASDDTWLVPSRP